MTVDQFSQKTPKTSHKAEQRFASGDPTRETTTEHEEGATSPVDGLKLLFKQARELKEYFSQFIAAKTDGYKLAFRNTAIGLALALMSLMALCGFFVMAGWFVLSGIAGGLGILFGGRWWLGNLTTGMLFLGGLALGVYIAKHKGQAASRERTIKKYETRRDRQQSEFGRTVSHGSEHADSESE